MDCWPQRMNITNSLEVFSFQSSGFPHLQEKILLRISFIYHHGLVLSVFQLLSSEWNCIQCTVRQLSLLSVVSVSFISIIVCSKFALFYGCIVFHIGICHNAYFFYVVGYLDCFQFSVMNKALVTFSLSPVHTQGGLVEAQSNVCAQLCIDLLRETQTLDFKCCHGNTLAWLLLGM